MAFCPHCGKPTDPAVSFCSACGRALTPGPEPPPPAAIASPMSSAAPLGAPIAAPMPAAAQVRPVGVTIIGVVSVILGAFAGFAALAMVLFATAGAAWMNMWAPDFWPAEAGTAFFAMMMVIGALFVAAFAALAIVAGVGSLRGRAWAWALTLIVMGFNALRGLGELASRDITGVFTLLVSAGVIWYYFQPDVKRWFGRA